MKIQGYQSQAYYPKPTKQKAQGHIPPGLAKKQASQLPDGNPWKQILLQQEQERNYNQ